MFSRFQNDFVANEGTRPIFECYSRETHVKYKLNLEKFEIVNTSSLKEWMEFEAKGDDALDWLYDKYGIKEITGLDCGGIV